MLSLSSNSSICNRANGKGSKTDALDKQVVLESLLRAHEAYFDVSRDYTYAGRTFPGFAEFRSHSEQFVLVKRAKLWEVDAFEYIFFDTVGHLGKGWLDEAFQYMTTEAIGKVSPDENHMTSYISLIAIADSVDSEALSKVRKLRFRKSFKLGFRGWADLRLAVIDLSSMEVVANGMGKEMAPTLRSCLQAVQRTSLDARLQTETIALDSAHAAETVQEKEVELS